MVEARSEAPWSATCRHGSCWIDGIVYFSLPSTFRREQHVTGSTNFKLVAFGILVIHGVASPVCSASLICARACYSG
jgi:hypothetical protein